jgi:hypothetical protein
VVVAVVVVVEEEKRGKTKRKAKSIRHLVFSSQSSRPCTGHSKISKKQSININIAHKKGTHANIVYRT